MENYERLGYLKEPFRLFHLKDDKAKEIPLHYHDFDKVIVFWGGRVSYMIEGKSYYLEPGDIILVGKNLIHKPTVEKAVAYERSIFYISREFLESKETADYKPCDCFLRADREKSYVIRISDIKNTRLGELVLRLEENEKEELYGKKEYSELLFLSFMVELNRMCRDGRGERAGSPPGVYHEKIMEILTYINEHLTEDFSVENLANTFYMSKYHMMRQFKAQTGYTIHRYRTEKRIIAAKEMLLNDIPVTKVGEECGFQDYSTFLRAFQSCVHMTPSEFLTDRRFGRK